MQYVSELIGAPVRDPAGRFAYTVISNKTSGAWPVSQRIEALTLEMRSKLLQRGGK